MLKEMLITNSMLGNGGGGGGVNVFSLTVTHNGTYDGSELNCAYSPVYVNVQPEYPTANPVVLWNSSSPSTETKVYFTFVEAEWDSAKQKRYLAERTTWVREGRSGTYTIPIYPAGEAIVKIECSAVDSTMGDIEVFDAEQGLYKITGACTIYAQGLPFD